MNKEQSWTQRRAMQPLRGRVVVITGASSGIGRAAARAFAGAGARLVLAARNEDALHAVAGECAQRGAHALVQRTDVGDAAAVEELARVAAEAFGRIDVWINNAGVGLFGPFTHAGVELHRRVVETNLFGTMNAAAAVLPYFMEQRRGTMITNISLGGFSPVPFAAAYTAGKFGLRGFMAALRQEVADVPGIRLCSLFPSVVDTPGFEHGANVSGVELKSAWPRFAPETVAAAMIRLALHPQAETCVGWPARLAKAGYGVAPATVERATGLFFRSYLRRAPVANRTAGNLFAPSDGRMTPRSGENGSSDSQRRRETTARALTWAGLAGAGAALAAVGIARWSADREGKEARGELAFGGWGV